MRNPALLVSGCGNDAGCLSVSGDAAVCRLFFLGCGIAPPSAGAMIRPDLCVRRDQPISCS